MVGGVEQIGRPERATIKSSIKIVKREIQTIPFALGALGALLLFLPDLDLFAADFRTGPGLLETAFQSDPATIYNTFNKIALVIMAICCIITAASWLKRARLNLFLGATIALIVYGYFLQIQVGVPLSAAMTTNALRGLYLMTFATIIGCDLAKNPNIVTGVALGMLGAAGLRLAYAAYSFFAYGGVQAVEGIPSLAMDGGALLLWGFIAAGAGCMATLSYTRRDFMRCACFLLVMAVFLTGVAASFRRTAMLLLIGNLGLGLMIMFWFRGQLLEGIKWVGLVLVSGLLGMYLVMVATFGLTTTQERILSLTGGGITEFSSSNNGYLDDQAALFESLVFSRFAGVGPGMDYGVRRVIDDYVFEGVPPLHTGGSELWASFGLAGMAYHLLILVWMPVSCIRAYRRHPVKGTEVFVALAAGEFLFIIVWPFAPPFYISPQSSLLTGFCLGYLIHIAGSSDLGSRSRREWLADPSRGSVEAAR